MGFLLVVGRPVNTIAARWLDTFQPLLAVAVRAWVGWQFYKSGLTKIASWDTTFGAAISPHYLWGLMLLMLAVYGPGRLSLDELLFNPARRYKSL